MKKLSKRWKHLEVSINSYAPSKDYQYISQKLSKEANSGVSINKFRSFYGQAVSSYFKAKQSYSIKDFIQQAKK